MYMRGCGIGERGREREREKKNMFVLRDRRNVI